MIRRIKRYLRGRHTEVHADKILIGLMALVLCLMLLGLTGSGGRIWAAGMRMGAGLREQVGRNLLLSDKAVLSYVVYGEADKGLFRQMTENARSQERLLKVTLPEGEEKETREEKNGEGIQGSIFFPEDGELEKPYEAEQMIEIEASSPQELPEEHDVFEEYLPVSYVSGNIAKFPDVAEPETPVEREPLVDVKDALTGAVSSKLLIENHYSMEKLSNANELLSQYYIVDSVTSTVPSLFDAKELLSKDLSIEKKEEGIQILIYHTHGSEGFADSRAGVAEDTVRGPGELLAEYLRGYGYQVYHDMTAYDRKDGQDNRNAAYSTACPQIEAFLSEHPEVEVIIDLHRDSGSRRVAMIDGKPTAKLMLFNGLCRNASGPIDYLENPNLKGNLAFSLQLNLVGRVLYPDLMYRIYLKNYRYNMHFRERCLLIELGTEENTVEEAYNAMKPLAEILDSVLRK